MAKTETITASPWEAQAPYLEDVFSEAQNLYQGGGPRFYPRNMTAGFGQDTTNALNMYRKQAMTGNPQVGALNNMMTGTLQGDYLHSNPYLDSVYDSAADAVTRNYREAVAPGIDARFGSSGRYGSGMYANQLQGSQETLGKSLGDMSAKFYGQNYANERTNQMRAAALSPTTVPLNYYDASQLLNVGQMKDQNRQAKMNEQYNRYMFNQNRPWDAAQRYHSLITGNYGGSSTRPLYQNDAMKWAGLGLGGASVLNQIFSNRGAGGTLDPWGGVQNVLGDVYGSLFG